MLKRARRPITPYSWGYRLGSRNIHSAVLPYTDSASYLEFYRGHQAGFAEWKALRATAWQRACYAALERARRPMRRKAAA